MRVKFSGMCCTIDDAGAVGRHADQELADRLGAAGGGADRDQPVEVVTPRGTGASTTGAAA